jgi:tRNA pseudouridine55 synthase
MDGILNILKPPGMTSFDVVAYLRRLTGVRRIGHTGTLDPMAAGVLPVCVGRAAKAVEFLMEKDKLYRAEMILGVTTDTQDTTGVILDRKKPALSDTEITEAVSAFAGKYMQRPPMYSAVRVKGRKLYQLAREGVEIERPEREVVIYSAEVVSISRKDDIRVLFDVHCSKGTYIRTLCADIGDALGCGGCMSFLLRLGAGPFHISGSVTLEELSRRKEEGTLKEMMIPPDKVFSGLDSCVLDEGSGKKFMNGVQIPLSGLHIKKAESTGTETETGKDTVAIRRRDKKDDGLIRVYGSDGRFIALGMIIHGESGNYLKARKFF